MHSVRPSDEMKCYPSAGGCRCLTFCVFRVVCFKQIYQEADFWSGHCNISVNIAMKPLSCNGQSLSWRTLSMLSTNFRGADGLKRAFKRCWLHYMFKCLFLSLDPVEIWYRHRAKMSNNKAEITVWFRVTAEESLSVSLMDSRGESDDRWSGEVNI